MIHNITFIALAMYNNIWRGVLRERLQLSKNWKAWIHLAAVCPTTKQLFNWLDENITINIRTH